MALVFKLRTTIEEQIPDGDGDLLGSNAKILLRQPECTGPSPGSVEHVSMQFANELIIQHRKLSPAIQPTQRDRALRFASLQSVHGAGTDSGGMEQDQAGAPAKRLDRRQGISGRR